MYGHHSEVYNTKRTEVSLLNSPYSMFYLTTSAQMKHFQCVVYKPECSIQTQVVIQKVLMIKSSAVTEPK